MNSGSGACDGNSRAAALTRVSSSTCSPASTCFSHYVAAGAVALTGFRLLVTGWTGALIAWLTLVWVANVYMSLFVRLRLDIKRERVEISEISAEERDAAVGPQPRQRRLS